MARVDQAHPAGTPGRWFVDTRCVGCDAARHWAPGLIGLDDNGRSFLARQPTTSAEEEQMWRAAMACPTASIGNRDQRRPATAAFPHELTDGVYATGHNASSSFGAHSYLVTHSEENILIDSPRFVPSLAKQIDELGGIDHVLLSHRDDVADADRWADRYGARVWIHHSDADAAPFATDLLSDDPTEVCDGVVSIHAPGHTAGHVVFHIEDRWLFSGDTLHWNHRRGELDVTPKQTWHSWTVLAGSIERIGRLHTEWVFPGHGMWHNFDPASFGQQMAALSSAMHTSSQQQWSNRPHTAFNWY
ncbi:MAG: MBL fold metallo-hydrolase [Actinomycetota bacterium]|nr:MBL fold metallo-hydrolase [Actinomycetota bacterium]